MDDKLMDFKLPTDATKIIKVIGVGGGGVNAVNHMYDDGIQGVNFAVCNTDKQSFVGVKVPVTVVLGEGLGAGGDPNKAKEEFEKSKSEVETLFDPNTKMVFVATGMGGGTGSGAAPLIAKMAKEKGILTVGIVTIPFLFERIPRIIKALDAVKEMSKNVDSLIVINNERLRDIYPDYDLVNAFKKADETLAMAAKSIAEIITVKGIVNRDFNDVRTTMKDGGVALVSYGFGKGENRLDDAIQQALNSPLLNNNDISNAKRILFYISFGKDSHLKVEELTKSMDGFMTRFDNHIAVSWGYGIDEALDAAQEVKFTIIATGFGIDDIPVMKEQMDDNEILVKQQMEEQKAEDEKRVKATYHTEIGTSSIKVHKVSPKSIIVLTMEELNDEEILTYMEENPTYRRDPAEVAKKRKKDKGTQDSPNPSAAKNSTVISF